MTGAWAVGVAYVMLMNILMRMVGNDFLTRASTIRLKNMKASKKVLSLIPTNKEYTV